MGHGLAAEGAVGVAGLQTVAEGQVVGDGAGGEAAVQYQVRGEEFEKAAGEVGAGGALGQHETRGGGEQAARVGEFGQAELEVKSRCEAIVGEGIAQDDRGVFAPLVPAVGGEGDDIAETVAGPADDLEADAAQRGVLGGETVAAIGVAGDGAEVETGLQADLEGEIIGGAGGVAGEEEQRGKQANAAQRNLDVCDRTS